MWLRYSRDIWPVKGFLPGRGQGCKTAIRAYIPGPDKARMDVRSINFLGRRIPVPRNMLLRILLGVVLVLGGFLGFLPILGYWMVPVGLLVLSIDFPVVRRFRRNATVRLGAWFKQRWPKLATKLGMTQRKPVAPE